MLLLSKVRFEAEQYREQK